MKYPFEQTDGGRSLSIVPTQDKDCVVRALSLAFDKNYSETYELLKKAGRKDNKGMVFIQFVEKKLHKKLFGKELLEIPCKLTVAKLMSGIGSGIFLARKRGHIFCIRNGVVLDTFAVGDKARIINLYKVIN